MYFRVKLPLGWVTAWDLKIRNLLDKDLELFFTLLDRCIKKSKHVCNNLVINREAYFLLGLLFLLKDEIEILFILAFDVQIYTLQVKEFLTEVRELRIQEMVFPRCEGWGLGSHE